MHVSSYKIYSRSQSQNLEPYPLKRLSQPSEITDTAAYLTRDAVSYITG